MRGGPENTGVSLDCFVFTEDDVLFEDNLQTSVKNIEIMKKIAAKTGLRIFIENTKWTEKRGRQFT